MFWNLEYPVSAKTCASQIAKPLNIESNAEMHKDGVIP
jgi:hypothetical protein